MKPLYEHLQRNVALLIALGACVLLCLLMNLIAPSAEATPEDAISRVLSAMAGAGHTEVAVYRNAQDVPCGAVVIADGAQDISVRLWLTDAVATLLGLDASAVVVYPSQGGTP